MHGIHVYAAWKWSYTMWINFYELFELINILQILHLNDIRVTQSDYMAVGVLIFLSTSRSLCFCMEQSAFSEFDYLFSCHAVLLVFLFCFHDKSILPIGIYVHIIIHVCGTYILRMSEYKKSNCSMLSMCQIIHLNRVRCVCSLTSKKWTSTHMRLQHTATRIPLRWENEMLKSASQSE